MAKGLFILTSVALLTGFCASQNAPPSVYCAVQNDVLIETDPGSHRYLPYITKMPRCGGTIGSTAPSIKKCVKKTAENVTYKVRNVHTFQTMQLTIEHHKTCMTECTLGFSSCDARYQTWDSLSCKCRCKYLKAPVVSPCTGGRVWKQSACTCACATLATSCSIKKEWNQEECGCTCTNRYLNRCSRKLKMINREDCSCIDQPIKYINNTAAARQSNMTCGTIKTRIVIMIVVLELLFLVVAFYFVYTCCLRHDPDLDRPTSFQERVEYNVNKAIQRFSLGKKAKVVPPPRPVNGTASSTPQPLEKNSSFSNTVFTREESTELRPNECEKPVGFYQPDPYYFESDTTDSLASEPGKVTVV